MEERKKPSQNIGHHPYVDRAQKPKAKVPEDKVVLEPDAEGNYALRPPQKPQQPEPPPNRENEFPTT